MNEVMYPTMGFHGPFALILTILLMIAAVWLISRMWHGRSVCGHGDGKGALDVLGERYALGEIDSEEYQDKRKVLKSR
ncbi:MAG: SHOCT domain-containing protein [Rhodospirillales bacterium]